MTGWNPTKRRLENGSVHHYTLQDIPEPNLFRDIFPYDAVPKIVFDGQVEKLDPAPEFYITDTTFRDGQQARPPSDQYVDKKSEAVMHITEWVDSQYRQERTTSISDEEMLAQVRAHLPYLVESQAVGA